uniref:Uncharacterized protein LOC105054548 n=1 Tax=Elaeis guineensis var. tenera TaxID=51953 RepID=A0A8N4F280_ELAGV|nr:uncharacterized protein LOC105054548 [Elaeis guineensis]
MSSADGGGYHPIPPPFPFSFHLLEVTAVSAQDLFANPQSTRSYAVASVDPAPQLRTRLDAASHTEPTWNDKFVSHVDDAVLRSDIIAVTVNICAAPPPFLPASDTLIGTALAVLSAHPTPLASSPPRSAAPGTSPSSPSSPPPAPPPPSSSEKREPELLQVPGREHVAVESKLGRSLALDKERAARGQGAKLAKWRSELPPLPDLEGAAVASKLTKWREELPPFPNGETKANEKEKGDGDRGKRRMQRRRGIGRLACVAGGGEGEWETKGGKLRTREHERNRFRRE